MSFRPKQEHFRAGTTFGKVGRLSLSPAFCLSSLRLDSRLSDQSRRALLPCMLPCLALPRPALSNAALPCPDPADAHDAAAEAATKSSCRFWCRGGGGGGGGLPCPAVPWPVLLQSRPSKLKAFFAAPCPALCRNVLDKLEVG